MSKWTEVEFKAAVAVCQAELIARQAKPENPKSILGRLNAYRSGRAECTQESLAKEVARYQYAQENYKPDNSAGDLLSSFFKA